VKPSFASEADAERASQPFITGNQSADRPARDANSIASLFVLASWFPGE